MIRLSFLILFYFKDGTLSSVSYLNTPTEFPTSPSRPSLRAVAKGNPGRYEICIEI